MPSSPEVHVDAAAPVAQRRHLRQVDGRTVAFVETSVFIAGDPVPVTAVALEMLRGPWGGHEDGWWGGASTTFVVRPETPSTDTGFSFDFRPLFCAVPVWARAVIGALAGVPWGPWTASAGALVAAVVLPRALSPTLIRVEIETSEAVAGCDGVRLPATLSGDFVGPAELTLVRQPGGVVLRSAWLGVRYNKPMPQAFASGLHGWRERAVLLHFKRECERRAAGAHGTA
jgi:hypothetical protein